MSAERHRQSIPQTTPNPRDIIADALLCDDLPDYESADRIISLLWRGGYVIEERT